MFKILSRSLELDDLVFVEEDPNFNDSDFNDAVRRDVDVDDDHVASSSVNYVGDI